MTKDGAIYKVTQGDGDQSNIVTCKASRWLIRRPGAGLERRILTGGYVRWEKSNLTSATALPAGAGSNETATDSPSGGRPRTRFDYWGRYDGLVAMILRPGGSLAAWVRTVSRRLCPATGAVFRFGDDRNGFAPASRRIINTADTVYALDLEHRATKAIFTLTNESSGPPRFQPPRTRLMKPSVESRKCR